MPPLAEEEGGRGRGSPGGGRGTCGETTPSPWGRMTGRWKSPRGSREDELIGVEPEVGRELDASNSNVETLKADGGRPSRALLRL